MRRTALIIGARGYLGRHLTQHFLNCGWVVEETSSDIDYCRTANAIHFDLRAPNYDAMLSVSPRLAIVCAGVSGFDACEQRADAHLINVDNTIALIERLNSNGIRVFFLSSNAVYATGNYVAGLDTERLPETAYGKHKKLVEDYLADTPGVAIIRSTKVFHDTHVLLQRWRMDLNQGGEISPFADVFLSPISVRYYVRALYALQAAGARGACNLSGEKNISYYDFVSLLFDAEGYRKSQIASCDAKKTMTLSSPRTLPCLAMDRDCYGLSPQPLDSVILDCKLSPGWQPDVARGNEIR